jgi:hypothetical protein
MVAIIFDMKVRELKELSERLRCQRESTHGFNIDTEAYCCGVHRTEGESDAGLLARVNEVRAFIGLPVLTLPAPS